MQTLAANLYKRCQLLETNSGVDEIFKLGCGDFAISEAVDEVIVHHSDCLHMCVYNSGTHECESAAFQVLAERIGFARGRGNLLHDFPAVHFGLSAYKAPRVYIKTSELVLNSEKRP